MPGKILPERSSSVPTELFNPPTRITPRQTTANICCLVKGTAENGEDGYPLCKEIVTVGRYGVLISGDSGEQQEARKEPGGTWNSAGRASEQEASPAPKVLHLADLNLLVIWAYHVENPSHAPTLAESEMYCQTQQCASLFGLDGFLSLFGQKHSLDIRQHITLSGGHSA